MVSVFFISNNFIFNHFKSPETKFFEDKQKGLRSSSNIPFDGMYYIWEGELAWNYWTGSDNFTKISDEIYHVEFDAGWAGTDSRDINITDRQFYSSSIWSLGGHDWLFIPIEINLGESILIAYLDGDHNFTVTDRINISSGLGREFDCWKLEDSTKSLAYYDIYTGLLINGTFKSSSTNWYSFNVTATNVQFQNNTQTPILMNGTVSPSEGNTSNYYTFSVNYTDADNNAPHPINVIIDSVPYEMVKQNQSDTDYPDGVIYEYNTVLDNSSHSYSFNASDLVFTTRLPIAGDYLGPNVTYINSYGPTLSDALVNPPSGNNYTDFRFQVTYSDADNNPPQYMNVTINGTMFRMEKMDLNDNDYIDGVVYSYQTKLSEGIHSFCFNASDGVNSISTPSNGSFIGPSVYLAFWALWDDIESGQNGWSITGIPTANSTFGWHITERDSKSQTHAWWCGDNTTGEYHNNWDMSLVSRTLNLTTAYSAILSFYHKADLEYLNDFGYVEIEINGTGTWDRITLFNQTISTWTKEIFNLSYYLGEYVNIRFRFKSDITQTYGGWYIDDIIVETQQNSFAPVLDQGQVSPSSGNMSTLYTYMVKYSDPDGNPAEYIHVIIDGVNHSMSKQNPSDIDYVSGVNYVYSTYLDNSTHEYYCTASDGLFSTREPFSTNNSGPIVTATYLVPPSLTGFSHNPANGRLTTNFIFDVIYTDIENTPPTFVNITINGTSHAMTKLNQADTNYMDGVSYQFQTNFVEDGVYIYNFSTSDGWNAVHSPVNGSFTGPYVYLLRLWHSTSYLESITEADKFDNFMFEISNTDYAAVAVRPPQNSTNLDLSVFENYQLSTLVAQSNLTDKNVDFIAIDRHGELGTVYWYALVSSIMGYGSYQIEAEYSIPDLNVAVENFSYSMSLNEVFDMYEFTGHTANYPYNISVYNTAGLDLGLYVVTNTGGRSTAINSSNKGGINEKESVLFYPSSSNEFGVIITNENGVSGNYELKIFVQRPNVQIISPQNKTFTTSALSVNLTSTTPNLHTMWFRVRNSSQWVTDNITWSPGMNLTLVDGSYSIFAWANDTVGLISEVAILNFTIDTIPPTLSIISPLNESYDITNILVNLSSSALDLDSLWYRIYNLTDGSWIDPYNITWTEVTSRILSEGVFRLFAWVNDTNGNEMPVPINVTFTINTPPTLSILSPSNITYSTQNITITLTSPAPDLDKMWYMIHNGTSWVVNKTIWAPGSFIVLDDGYYTLYAWANDSLGQETIIPLNISFSIDTTPPTISILTPLNIIYNTMNIWIDFYSSSADLEAVWYRIFSISQNSWVDLGNISWSAPILRSLDEDTYILYVWANDSFGNSLLIPLNVTFEINLPPQISFVSIINNTIYNTNSIFLNISVDSVDCDKIWYNIFNGTDWITGNMTWIEPINIQLEDGNYILFIWVNDTQGNQIFLAIYFNIETSPSPKGFDKVWVIIIIIAVGAIVSFITFRYKKTKKKKQSKNYSSRARDSFAERVKPVD